MTPCRRFSLLWLAVVLLLAACTPIPAAEQMEASMPAAFQAMEATSPSQPVESPSPIGQAGSPPPPPQRATVTPLVPTLVPPPETAVPPTVTPPPPTATPTPEPACEEPGRIETGTFNSAIAGEAMAYRVYLPPCYGQAGQSYPVLYMLGGNIHDDAIWDTLGLDEAAEAGIVAGTLQPLLIVMPDGGWIANNSSGGPFSYEGVITGELIPFIEQTYCALPDAAGRAIGGLSRGGYWSLMIAFRQPELFRSVGGHSPALIDSFAGPDMDPVYTGATNDLGDLRIYVDLGANDFYRTQAQPLHDALTAAGVAHYWLINEGTHEEAYWRGQVGNYLDWYDGGWNGLPEWPCTVGIPVE